MRHREVRGRTVAGHAYYLTINPFRGDGIFREGELDGRRAVYEGMFLRQVRFEKPLWVCIDGRSNKGIVKEEGDK